MSIELKVPKVGILESIGSTIRSKRKVSTVKLGKKVGLHRVSIENIELGKSNVTIKNLDNIASGLNMKLSTLIKMAGY